uniref:Mu transposase C-terminal domain-containing protein n=1 Tax=Arthrobacter terrae TaxID=2935737 RepID=UPI0035E45BE1
MVRYDPRDITEICVFHKNQFICKAVNPDHKNLHLGPQKHPGRTIGLPPGTARTNQPADRRRGSAHAEPSIYETRSHPVPCH